MIKFVVYTRDTRIHDVDYLFEDCEKLLKLVPYLKKKIESEDVGKSIGINGMITILFLAHAV